MGKSVAAEILKTLGCPVHDSDKAAFDALQPGGASFEEVAVTFPESWDKKRHVIKRDVLGDLVFSDPVRRKELEDIIHPAIRAAQNEFLKKQRALRQKIVVLDIPLLFETGADKRVDYTLVVTAPYAIQRRRVLSRPNMNEEKFLNILNRQMPDQDKQMRADFVVSSGLGRAQTFKDLQNVLKQIHHA